MRVFCWTPSFHVDKESSLVPVWFSLPALPIHLLDKQCLFSIVSVVGPPLFIDSATASLIRPSVARVCVEVDLLKELPDVVWIGTEGETGGFWQKVEPKNLPAYCKACLTVGHSMEGCRKEEGHRVDLKPKNNVREVKDKPVAKQIYVPVVASQKTNHQDTADQIEKVSNLQNQSAPNDKSNSVQQQNDVVEEGDKNFHSEKVQEHVAGDGQMANNLMANNRNNENGLSGNGLMDTQQCSTMTNQKESVMQIAAGTKTFGSDERSVPHAVTKVVEIQQVEVVLGKEIVGDEQPACDSPTLPRSAPKLSGLPA